MTCMGVNIENRSTPDTAPVLTNEDDITIRHNINNLYQVLSVSVNISDDFISKRWHVPSLKVKMMPVREMCAFYGSV